MIKGLTARSLVLIPGVLLYALVRILRRQFEHSVTRIWLRVEQMRHWREGRSAERVFEATSEEGGMYGTGTASFAGIGVAAARRRQAGGGNSDEGALRLSFDFGGARARPRSCSPQVLQFVVRMWFLRPHEGQLFSTRSFPTRSPRELPFAGTAVMTKDWGSGSSQFRRRLISITQRLVTSSSVSDSHKSVGRKRRTCLQRSQVKGSKQPKKQASEG